MLCAASETARAGATATPRTARRRSVLDTRVPLDGDTYSDAQPRRKVANRHTAWLRYGASAAARLTRLPSAKITSLGCQTTRNLLRGDRKSTRLNSSHLVISYAVFCLKKKKNTNKLEQRLH